VKKNRSMLAYHPVITEIVEKHRNKIVDFDLEKHDYFQTSGSVKNFALRFVSI